MALDNYYDEKWFSNRLEKITEDTEFTDDFSTQVEFLIDCYLSDIFFDIVDLAERNRDRYSEGGVSDWVYRNVPSMIESQLNARFCPPIPGKRRKIRFYREDCTKLFLSIKGKGRTYWKLYLDDFINEAESYPSFSGLPGPKYY